MEPQEYLTGIKARMELLDVLEQEMRSSDLL
jgi:hypothetical protein